MLLYAHDLVCFSTPNILEQYLMSSSDTTSPLSGPLVVRSTKQLKRVTHSYTENISEKYRFSLDSTCTGQRKCLIVVNYNTLSYPVFNNPSYRGFEFIHLSKLKSSTYFTNFPPSFCTTRSLYDASDVWKSKYHVDCIAPRIAKLKLFIRYLNVYSRLLKVADLQPTNTNRAGRCEEPNLLSTLPKEILSRIAWIIVHL